MAYISSVKEKYEGDIVKLKKSSLSPTNTPSKYDIVCLNSNNVIEKAISLKNVDNNNVLGIIVNINNSTNEVLILTQGLFVTTQFDTIDGILVPENSTLFLSSETSGAFSLTAPSNGVHATIGIMTKRGLYIDSFSYQETFLDQSSFDAIQGNLSSFNSIL